MLGMFVYWSNAVFIVLRDHWQYIMFMNRIPHQIVHQLDGLDAGLSWSIPVLVNLCVLCSCTTCCRGWWGVSPDRTGGYYLWCVDLNPILKSRSKSTEWIMTPHLPETTSTASSQKCSRYVCARVVGIVAYSCPPDISRYKFNVASIIIDIMLVFLCCVLLCSG